MISRIGSHAPNRFGDRTLILLYNIVLLWVVLLASPLILVHVLTSLKRKKTFLKRLGVSSSMSFGTRPVWVHALSVGEVLSAVPLVRTIRTRYPHRPLVFSVSTLTGHRMAKAVLERDTDGLFYFPYDFLWSVRRAVRQVDPGIFFLVESDIWPNFLFELKRQKRPSVLVNGRISPRSFRGYKRFSFFMRAVFSWISLICVQSKLDRRRFELIGTASDKIFITGNIKFDKDFDAVSEHDVKQMRAQMQIKSGQKVLLAGSTHEGEESILFDVFFRLKKAFVQTVLVVVPRDPERAKAVSNLVTSYGGVSMTFTELQSKTDGGPLDVIVVDKMGILGRLYAMTDIAFIGGSLVKSGGHNPLEAAAYAKPVVFGPDMSDFSSVAEMLVEKDGAIQVRHEQDLFPCLKKLLEDDERAAATGRQALVVFQNNKGAVDKTIRATEPFLMP